jgi:hypothetical protein
MKLAIFDAFSGAGGDMIVASLLDVALDQDDLVRIPEILGIEVRVKASKVMKKGISAWHVDVESKGGDTERTFREVREILSSSELDDQIKQDAAAIFEILARAEGRIHGRDYREAVFHEVGSDDAIFDIVAAVTGIRKLKERGYRIFTTPVRLGSGFVEFSHGKYPVPAPATLEIISESKIEVIHGGEGELLTPTAAAILAYYSEGTFRQPFTVEKVSYGAGDREGEVPNVLRLILASAALHDSIVVIETNVDDATGEVIGYALEKLASLAYDVAAIPTYGKKGRPSIILKAISSLERSEEVAKIMMEETGSLGVRIIPIHHRVKAHRNEEIKEVKIGGKKFSVRVKRSFPDGEVVKAEFEDVKRIAEETGLPLRKIYEMIRRWIE